MSLILFNYVYFITYKIIYRSGTVLIIEHDIKRVSMIIVFD